MRCLRRTRNTGACRYGKNTIIICRPLSSNWESAGSLMQKVQQCGGISKGVEKRPQHGGLSRKVRKTSEKELHLKAQQWLEKSGWWHKLLIFHVPNERRGDFGAMMHFKRLGVRPGVADYLVFGARQDTAIELKE